MPDDDRVNPALHVTSHCCPPLTSGSKRVWALHDFEKLALIGVLSAENSVTTLIELVSLHITAEQVSSLVYPHVQSDGDLQRLLCTVVHVNLSSAHCGTFGQLVHAACPRPEKVSSRHGLQTRSDDISLNVPLEHGVQSVAAFGAFVTLPGSHS